MFKKFSGGFQVLKQWPKSWRIAMLVQLGEDFAGEQGGVFADFGDDGVRMFP